MNTSLIQTIQKIFPLNEEMMKLLMDKVEVFEFPAKYKLVRAGTIANMIYFVEKGASRSYYLKEGNEITTWFSFENEFTTSLYSFITRQPSPETIELLENSILCALRFNDLNELTDTYPAINHLYRKVLELNFIRQENLLAERFVSAKEKYKNLISAYPEILQRVSLGHIASYLGITQSTLSRIRRKRD